MHNRNAVEFYVCLYVGKIKIEDDLEHLGPKMGNMRVFDETLLKMGD